MGDWKSKLMSGAVGAGQSALGMGLGMLTAGWQDRRQLEQAKKLQELQMQGQKQMGIFNREQAMQMWKDTNYKAQKEQMKKAGLSPGLMYGGSGAGGATTQGAGAGNVSGQGASPTQDLGAAMMLAQIEKTKAETDEVKAKTDVAERESRIKSVQLTRDEIAYHIESVLSGAEYTGRAKGMRNKNWEYYMEMKPNERPHFIQEAILEMANAKADAEGKEVINGINAVKEEAAELGYNFDKDDLPTRLAWSLAKEQGLDMTSVRTIQMIYEYGKEIAEAIGLRTILGGKNVGKRSNLGGKVNTQRKAGGYNKK